MADTPEPKGGGGTFGFLGKKVFGKVPVWVIAVGAVGGYYWYTHYGPGKKTAAQQQQQTDPAGNVCAAINPDTGYCPGSVEDTAALQAAAAASDGTGSATTGAAGPAGPEGPPGPPGPAGNPCRPGYSFSAQRKMITAVRGKKAPDWYAVPGGYCTATSSPPAPPPGGGGPGPGGRPRPVLFTLPPRPVPVLPAPRRQPRPVSRKPLPAPQPVRVYAPGTTGSVYASTA